MSSQEWDRTPSIMADFHNPTAGMKPETKCAVVANFIHNMQETRLWTTGARGEGVFLKKTKGSYITCPETLKTDGTRLYRMVQAMNVSVSQPRTILPTIILLTPPRQP